MVMAAATGTDQEQNWENVVISTTKKNRNDDSRNEVSIVSGTLRVPLAVGTLSVPDTICFPPISERFRLLGILTRRA